MHMATLQGALPLEGTLRRAPTLSASALADLELRPTGAADGVRLLLPCVKSLVLSPALALAISVSALADQELRPPGAADSVRLLLACVKSLVLPPALALALCISTSRKLNL